MLRRRANSRNTPQAISDYIGRRQVMALSDDYIYSHVLTFRSSPSAPYGRDTYYGQKFFYKTAQGCLLTISIPKVLPEPTDRHNPRRYPLLPNTLRLLDRIGTSLYEHALIPVALAPLLRVHSFAHRVKGAYPACPGRAWIVVVWSEKRRRESLFSGWRCKSLGRLLN